MKDRVRWGILGAAGIAYKAILPALKASEFAQATAIASSVITAARTVTDLMPTSALGVEAIPT